MNSDRTLRSQKRKDSFSETSKEDNPSFSFIWVQCDSCQKWRKVDKCMEDKLEDMWYCYMNPEPSYQSCDISEEEWESPATGWIYTYQGFLVGQLVWAKMTSYPPWPSIISPDPWCSNTYVSREDDGLLYHVEFLGKNRSHLWLPEERVETYQKSCSLEGRKSCPGKQFKYNRKLQQAISEADSLVTLSNEERLALCQYTAKEKERLEKSSKIKTTHKPSKQSLLLRQSQSSKTTVSNSSDKQLQHSPDTKEQSSKACNSLKKPDTQNQSTLVCNSSKSLSDTSILTAPSSSENVATLLKLLHMHPLLNGLLLQRNNTAGLSRPQKLPHKSAEEQKSRGRQLIVPMPPEPKRRQKSTRSSRKVKKKKKQSSVMSQSILQYFEPRNTSQNDSDEVLIIDHVVPENIDEINDMVDLDSFDLEKDLEKDMMEIELMLSQFDTEHMESDTDCCNIVEEELSQIEELLSSFES